MIGNQHIRSFYFNGKSTEELGLVLNYFRVKMPSKAKNRVPLPHTNKTLDFSTIYGEQLYSDRDIDAKVTLPGFEYLSHSDKWSFWTQFTNWLMSTTERSPLTYSMMPEYYFMAEVDKEPTFEEFEFSGAMSFTFSCYPFRVSSLPEGHDLVAFMNTKLDVRQQTNFTYKSSWSSFKQLNIGDYATYGAWATVYQTDTGTGTKINPGFHGYTYKIVDKKTVSQSRSQIAYKLDNHNEWLLEQDIVQAQTEYLDVVVVNPGISDVAPIITTNSSVTIVRDDEIYNLQPGVFETEQFVLKSGENHLKMYIPNVTLNIDFNFHKELI
ncbi:hypothetical protein [Stenotrophomonas phage vB_SmeS_BUCT704]|nr:hypothetical protein [Stenotrophomonas phage vB_SmeS_BUCT702]UUG68389.1 hypothetical protein [Stenotrophomonas phage vB_SmeS_BUCT704]